MTERWVVLLFALAIGVCSAKPTHSYDTAKSPEFIQAVEAFTKLVYDISLSFGGNSSETNDNGDQDAEDENTHHTDNLLFHILDSIRKGHATTENFVHWQAQLREQFAKGLITEEMFHDFLVEFNNITHSDSTNINDNCCLFG